LAVEHVHVHVIARAREEGVHDGGEVGHAVLGHPPEPFRHEGDGQGDAVGGVAVGDLGHGGGGGVDAVAVAAVHGGGTGGEGLAGHHGHPCVLDRGEAVRHNGEAGDTEGHGAQGGVVVEGHLHALVGVLVVHVVDDVHGADVDAGQPVHHPHELREHVVEVEDL